MADDGSTANEKEELKLKTDEDGKDEATRQDKVEDVELNDLLDSALEDFDKKNVASASPVVPQLSNPEEVLSTPPSADAPVSHMGGAGAGVDVPSEEMSDEMVRQFEEAMKSFMAQDPALMEQFQKLSSQAGHAGDSAEAQKEFAETLTETISGLQENAEGLQHEVSEEELSQAFSGLGTEGQAEGDFFPMMQGMMKMLLSKDVLYPSLKEIADKYPKWLSDHRESTEKAEYDNYTKQHKIIEAICTEFEAENDSAPDEEKRQRFEKLMELMQQMQELGQPPKDIVGEMAPGLEFDVNGMPKMPGLPAMGEQCSIM